MPAAAPAGGAGGAGGGGHNTRLSTANDAAQLKAIVVKFVGEPEATYNDSDTYRALRNAGITGLHDFLELSANDYLDLIVPKDPNTAGSKEKILPILKRKKLSISWCMVHQWSRKVGWMVTPTRISQAEFDDYRVSEYNPTEPVLPWKVPLPKQKDPAANELAAWRKNIRPSKQDFPEFKDEWRWAKTKEKTITALEASTLKHLIEDGHVPEHVSVDEAQQKCLYKIRQ